MHNLRLKHLTRMKLLGKILTLTEEERKAQMEKINLRYKIMQEKAQEKHDKKIIRILEANKNSMNRILGLDKHGNKIYKKNKH